MEQTATLEQRSNSTRFWMLLASIALIMALVGCKSDSNEKFIQGVWYYNDPHLANLSGESALEVRWVFDNGTFQFSSCCFVKAQYTGHYRILESKDSHLTLELYNLQGDVQGHSLSSRSKMENWIIIDREADTLRIGGQGPFERTSPES